MAGLVPYSHPKLPKVPWFPFSCWGTMDKGQFIVLPLLVPAWQKHPDSSRSHPRATAFSAQNAASLQIPSSRLEIEGPLLTSLHEIHHLPLEQESQGCLM
jgi:hypothetical protein